ncbi:MAG: adenine phosphoribosyltransferase [Steroidobacteraceae bacterium]|nr:adenine phosphoribosyltransferase [Steroidobacteraceae bacterium]MDW8258590.1 adenine phosphoribosyltransferase [Gammaproteobacteria bacterium]
MNDTYAPLRAAIRTIPDYPQPGIQFRDITPLLGNAATLRLAIDGLATPWRSERVDRVAGIEARGFILGGAVAQALGVGFVPLRKKGKLPHATVSVPYELEYGVEELEMHRDAVQAGDRVVIIDDLIATGGTAIAALQLLRAQGATVVGAAFVIDLPDLGGARRLAAEGITVRTLIAFGGH